MQRLVDREQAIRALQRGILAPLPEGPALSVAEFAMRVLSLDAGGFSGQVKTIMLNNRVVDNPREITVSDGDLLVLSGAMPGLVGAMLRSDSPIKAMRAGITAETTGPQRTGDRPSGYICLKAFNTVLKNHVDDILAYGAYIDG